MNQKMVFRICLSAVLIIFADLVCRMGISRIQNPQWVTILFIALQSGFIKEARKSWRGETIAWDYLTLFDKLIFLTGAIALLLFIFIPIELGLPWGIVLISTPLGLALNYVFVNKYGSESLKAFLFF